jgi:hypothetical protein
MPANLLSENLDESFGKLKKVVRARPIEMDIWNTDGEEGGIKD